MKIKDIFFDPSLHGHCLVQPLQWYGREVKRLFAEPLPKEDCAIIARTASFIALLILSPVAIGIFSPVALVGLGVKCLSARQNQPLPSSLVLIPAVPAPAMAQASNLEPVMPPPSVPSADHTESSSSSSQASALGASPSPISPLQTSMQPLQDSAQICAICLDPIGSDYFCDAHPEQPGHIFDSVCLYSALQQTENCPLCRKPIKQAIKDALADQISAPLKAFWETAKAERDAIIQSYFHETNAFEYKTETITIPPLWIAARAGNREAFKYYIKKQPGSEKDRSDALEIAIKNGHRSIVQDLFESGLLLDKDRDKAIRLATRYGHSEIVRDLLKNGPISQRSRQSAIQEASNCLPEVVLDLFQSGPISDKVREAVIDFLFEKGKREIGFELLQKGPISEKHRERLLCTALIKEDGELARYLLQKGPISEEFQEKLIDNLDCDDFASIDKELFLEVFRAGPIPETSPLLQQWRWVFHRKNSLK